MPASLCTAFTELREYAQLQNQYHDGTIQRAQLAKTSRRTFRLSKRLSASLLSALYSFWVSQSGGLTPFAFYNPFDVASGQQIGSNYDPDRKSTRLNSSHLGISYAVFCLKKKIINETSD